MVRLVGRFACFRLRRGKRKLAERGRQPRPSLSATSLSSTLTRRLLIVLAVSAFLRRRRIRRLRLRRRESARRRLLQYSRPQRRRSHHPRRRPLPLTLALQVSPLRPFPLLLPRTISHPMSLWLRAFFLLPRWLKQTPSHHLPNPPRTFHLPIFLRMRSRLQRLPCTRPSFPVFPWPSIFLLHPSWRTSRL